MQWFTWCGELALCGFIQGVHCTKSKITVFSYWWKPLSCWGQAINRPHSTAVAELFWICSHYCDLTFFSVYNDIFSCLHMCKASGLAEQKKVLCTSNLQSIKFERCKVLINIVRKIAFHTCAMTPFHTHFMVSLLITQDAFLTPFGLMSFLQSWPQVYWF